METTESIVCESTRPVKFARNAVAHKVLHHSQNIPSPTPMMVFPTSTNNSDCTADIPNKYTIFEVK